ncbi:hypothetical protein [Ulvibacterium sp.]|uniref:hypothetical protein n=1 Tax=Ulvibacterium sp. TaxID=2665914 RepID=UPI003CC64713
MKTRRNLIIYDKQGPLGNTIARSFQKTPITVYKNKKLTQILNLVKLKQKINFVFVLFIFNEEFELVESTLLAQLNVPIIFAPTNKHSYKNLIKMKGIEVVDVSKHKSLHISQILDFLEAHDT